MGIGGSALLPLLALEGESGGSDGKVSLFSRPFGTKLRMCSWRSPREESESASDSASPRSSSTSYARRELVRRMSSVRLVRVVERRVVCAVRVEMWVCVWDAIVESEGMGCCCFWEVEEGRVLLR